MSTHKTRFDISPIALLLFALGYFFDGSGLFSALVPAAAAHELGHLLLLHLGGLPVRRVSLGLAGLEIDYRGALTGLHGFLTVLAGPVFGLAYALAAARLGGEYFTLSAGLSLALSAFNLLPILPLDGGRLLLFACPRKGRGLSLAFALTLAAACLWLFLSRRSPAPFAMSLWLLWRNLHT